jgi:ATP-dependent Clp protease ATP-binding subunit ClpA
MFGNYDITNEVKQALQIARAIAKENQQGLFGGAHFLKALLHNDIGLATVLESWGYNIHYLRDWADLRISQSPKSARYAESPRHDDSIDGIFEVADVIRVKLGQPKVTPIAALIAICRTDVAFSRDKLKSLKLTEEELLERTLSGEFTPQANAGSSTTAGEGAGNSKTKEQAYLSKYCRDRISDARNGKIDPIVGREQETRQITEILGRRTKPNVIIIGEPGVGKTALIEGLALLIASQRVPANLQKAELYQLDMGSLIAGASYKGEIEDRLKGMLKEIKQYEKALLFIDEIHLLLDPQGGASGLVNLLKPELARGELTVIGATTLDEYRKYIEKDDAFGRRFETIMVEEPSEPIAVRMLAGLVPFFEKHHKLQVDHSALQEAVRLSKRYIKDRRLPDTAIDLLDRTMAAIGLEKQTSENELRLLKNELETIQKQFANEDPSFYLDELHDFDRKLNARLSPILIGKLKEQEIKMDGLAMPFIFSESLHEKLSQLENLAKVQTERVTNDDIAAVIAYKTGIPIGNLKSKERERLLLLEDYLKERVVGQDQVIKIIADTVVENRAGLTPKGQPIGSFFFAGPTGTGKTQLAKALAEFLFNDEKALLRFDMSEFKEEHSAALLIGAPPGYVGYEEGGILVNRIREQPYAVVLFDEIEKAHKSVFDIFLQILDEGHLHDRLGRKGDFSNSIILFTSNKGQETIVAKFAAGDTDIASALIKKMEEEFRPEFIARLTEVTPFRPISEDTIIHIFNIQLKPLLQTLDRQGITLTIEPDARRFLALEGYNPQLGARPLRTVIRNRITRPFSRMIVKEEVAKGDHWKLTYQPDQQPEISFIKLN